MKNLLLSMLIGFMGVSIAHAQSVTDKGRVIDAYSMTGDLRYITSDEQGSLLTVGENSLCLVSNNNGKKWQQLYLPTTRVLTRGSISLNTIMVLSPATTKLSSFVAVSINNGSSWKSLDSVIYPLLTENEHLTSIQVAKQGLLYIGSNRGKLIRSNDNGTSWEIIAELDTTIREIIVSGSRLFIMTNSNLYLYEDSSKQIAVISPPNDIREVENPFYHSLQIKADTITLFRFSSKENRTYFIVHEKELSSQQWFSTDSIPSASSIIKIYNNNVKYLYVSGVEHRLHAITKDNEKILLLDNDIQKSSFVSAFTHLTTAINGDIYVCGMNRIIATRTLEGGDSIISELPHKFVERPLDILLRNYKFSAPTIVSPYGNNILFAATQIPNFRVLNGFSQRNDNWNYIYKSIDSGATWQLKSAVRIQDFNSQGYESYGFSADKKEFYFAETSFSGPLNMVTTQDSGETWELRIPKYNDTVLLPDTYFYKTLSTGESIALTATFLSRKSIAYISSDNFKNDVRILFDSTLQLQSFVEENNGDIFGQAIDYDIQNGQQATIKSRGFFKLSPTTAVLEYKPWPGDIIRNYFVNSQLHIYATDDGGIVRSTDTAKTWERVLANEPNTNYFYHAITKEGIWVLATGFFGEEPKEMFFIHSIDDGVSWKKLKIKEVFNFNPENQAQNPEFGRIRVFNDSNIIADGTYTGHVFTLSIDPTATSVTDESSGIEALPGGWLYSPNPNPATTVLRADVRLYTGITVQQSKLGLYDVRSGKLVYDATPEQQRMAQTGGRTTIEIPTAEIPSGAYLLQLTTEKSIHTRKVIINR